MRVCVRTRVCAQRWVYVCIHACLCGVCLQRASQEATFHGKQSSILFCSNITELLQVIPYRRSISQSFKPRTNGSLIFTIPCVGRGISFVLFICFLISVNELSKGAGCGGRGDTLEYSAFLQEL